MIELTFHLQFLFHLWLMKLCILFFSVPTVVLQSSNIDKNSIFVVFTVPYPWTMWANTLIQTIFHKNVHILWYSV